MNGRTNSHGSSINELQVPLDPCTSLRAEAGNGEVTLYWDDPVDKYATPEGETAQDPQQLVSVWDHTIVVRKVGSQPANPNDGIVVTSSGIRDQYLSTGYIDTSLTNDTTYYYGVFAFNEDGVASEGAFADATPKLGTPLSELSEGTLIKIMENGSPVEFYLTKHNYEPDLNGQGRTLVVRKELDGLMTWNNESLNTWATCSLLSWLNSAYKQRLSTHIQNAIDTTKYRYTLGNYDDTVATRADAIFIPSLTEFGLSEPSANVEGSTLPIASLLLPAPSGQYTRSPSTKNDFEVWIISHLYEPYDRSCHVTEHVSHFAFTLSASIEVDENMNVL